MRNVLIIGASSDLAEDVIPRLQRRGCNLMLHCGHQLEKLEKYQSNHNICMLQSQIVSEADCDFIVQECRRWQPSLDALVILMGGMSHPVNWKDLSSTDYQRDYLVNAIFPILLATKLSANMTEDGGRIVFVSTASAKHGGGRNSLSYGMAKAALECAVKRFAKDLGPHGILVNAIAPGYMDTSLQIKAKGIPANENRGRIATIPVGRAGTKKEFASLVEYLLSDDASFITGQIITLDGGDFI